jgi:hypothetical protein
LVASVGEENLVIGLIVKKNHLLAGLCLGRQLDGEEALLISQAAAEELADLHADSWEFDGLVIAVLDADYLPHQGPGFLLCWHSRHREGQDQE